MDIDKVTHHDPRVETDRPRTTYEGIRRQEMHLKPIRYGFFRTGEEVIPEKCCECSSERVTIKVNSTPYCRDCYHNKVHASS